MKTIAAANCDFGSQIENGYAAADNPNLRPGALIGIQFRAKKCNVYEPLIERL